MGLSLTRPSSCQSWVYCARSGSDRNWISSAAFLCCFSQAAKAAKRAAEFEEHKTINAEVVARITAPYRYNITKSQKPKSTNGKQHTALHVLPVCNSTRKDMCSLVVLTCAFTRGPLPYLFPPLPCPPLHLPVFPPRFQQRGQSYFLPGKRIRRCDPYYGSILLGRSVLAER